MRWTILCVLAFFCLNLDAQIKRERGTEKLPIFGASAVLGGQLTQIDGDYYTGYDLPGLVAGARGVVRITRRDEIRMELLYSQQGSLVENSTLRSVNRQKERLLRMNYAEVPIVYYHKLDNRENGRGPGIEMGIAYGRLLNYRIEEQFSNFGGESYFEVEERFRSNQLSAVVGLNHRITPQIEIALRANIGLTKFYFNETVANSGATTLAQQYSVSGGRFEFMRNYGMSLVASYNFL